MARTNSRYFEYKRNILGEEAMPTPLKILIANSTTIKIGQLVRLNTSGFVVPAGIGNAILGLVTGMIDQGGTPVNSFAYSNGGNTLHTNSGDDTITTSSTNQTQAFPVYAEVVLLENAGLVYNQTNGNLVQANLLQFFNLVSTSDQVDQGTSSNTAGQMQLIALDPLGTSDLTAGLFKVAQSQLFGYGSGTWRTA